MVIGSHNDGKTGILKKIDGKDGIVKYKGGAERDVVPMQVCVLLCGGVVFFMMSVGLAVVVVRSFAARNVRLD